jgi:hypothetical protein
MSTIDKLYVLLFAILCSLGIGYLLTHPTPRPEIAAMARQADTLRRTADSARVTAIQTQYASKAAGQRERQVAGALRSQLAAVRDSLDALQQIQQDSAASIDSVRQALKGALHLADTLSIQVSVYLAAVDTLRVKHAEERRAMTVALEKADTALAHQDALIRVLQRQAECRVLGVRCPSRITVAVGAVAVGVIAGALLTR